MAKNTVESTVSKTEFKSRAKKNIGFSVKEVAGMLGYTAANVYHFLNGIKRDGVLIAKPLVRPSDGVVREKQESYKSNTRLGFEAVEKLAEKTERELIFAEA